MDGENNVWIVKLNPSGGLLTEREYKKWKNIVVLGQELEKEFGNKKDYKKKYKIDITKKCKEEGIVAIGWILNPKDTWLADHTDTIIDRKKYEEFYENTPWHAENKGNLNPSVQKFQEFKKGDFCWVRDSSDKYYVCKIEGDWYYDSSKEAWAIDIAQRYKCKWVKVGDATETPAEVVKKLITIGHTVSKMNNKFLNISKYLFENDGEKAIEKAVKEFDDNNYTPEDIIHNITEYEYEDIVGFYLQSKGFFIIPSTRYQSTKKYEFVAINKHGEKSIVQAKQQKGMLEGKDYERISETYTVYLACSGGVDMEGVDKYRIKEIGNAELEKFINENRSLLLDRIKFSVVYQKYQQQGN